MIKKYLYALSIAWAAAGLVMLDMGLDARLDLWTMLGAGFLLLGCAAGVVAIIVEQVK